MAYAFGGVFGDLRIEQIVVVDAAELNFKKSFRFASCGLLSSDAGFLPSTRLALVQFLQMP